jgi:hypothetical protein
VKRSSTVALAGEVERAKSLRDFPRVEKRLHASAHVRRCREQKVAQHVGDAIEHRVVSGSARRRARIFRDFRLRGVEPAADLEIPPSGSGRKFENGARRSQSPCWTS